MLSIASCASAGEPNVTKAYPRCLGSKQSQITCGAAKLRIHHSDDLDQPLLRVAGHPKYHL